ERNEATKQISELKKNKEDATDAITAMRALGGEIKELDNELVEIDEKLDRVLLSIPNIPQESVPIGETEDDNVEVRTGGEKKTYDFEIKQHREIGTDLDILDFERAGKVTGSRFVVYKGIDARVQLTLVNIMIDQHVDEHGYEEMIPAFIVNRESMKGTGQLPKFEVDAFKIADWDYFLIPTSEVPATNYHRDEILTEEELPKKYVANSACF